jgi:ElaB/YqjD/DUF883 family membrane-anchored ribosome-binding protein
LKLEKETTMTNSRDKYGNPISTDVAGMASAAGEQLSDVAQQAQDAAKQQFDKLSDAIRAKPIQAAGIAAGVGFLLALLARR